MKRSVLLALMAMAMLSGKLASQNSVQLTVTGIPPVLYSPYITDLENNYNQGLFRMQVTYLSSNPEPVDFVYEVTASKDGEQLAFLVSEPVSYTPGTYFYQTFDDQPAIVFDQAPLDQFPADLATKVLREGILPEGGYTIEIEIRPLDDFSMIATIPAFVYFEVRYPMAPMLVTPFDEGLVPPMYATFSWTPVFAIPGFQFEYELLIVELFEGQNPQQALEANPAYIQETLLQPMFIHTPQFLPLEFGKSFAWQVIAREVQERIPISDDGKSEIFTFTVGDLFGVVDWDEMESITLIPEFAEITNLSGLQVEPMPNGMMVNGFATLTLDFGAEGIVETTIDLQDLEIIITGSETAVAIGGSVTGDIQADIFPQEGIGNIITIERIQWSVFDGLTVDASIIDPGGNYLEAEGTLGITPAGFAGSVTATGPGGTPLVQMGIDPLELIIYRLTATFPGASLSADARVNYFNQPTPCQITNVFIDESPVSISFLCNIQEDIPLLPGEDLATLFLQTANGNIELDWENNTLDFNVSLSANLRLKALEGNHYDIPAFIGLSSDMGVSVQIWSPGTILNPPLIDLGLASLEIQNIRDPFLSYDNQNKEWDFGIDFDAMLLFPDLDDLKLTGMGGITLDKNGIHFPSYFFDENDLKWVPAIQLAGFGARLTSFTLPSFTFPWFDWDGMKPGPWDFSFGFEFTTPDFPGEMPSCLRNLSINIDNATFSEGVFTAELPPTTFEDNQCAISWAQGYSLNILKINGGIYGEASPAGLSLDGYLGLSANLKMGSPFVCGTESALFISGENLLLRSNGTLEGTISGVTSACPLKIGPYTAGMTDTKLSFFAENGKQSATFDASAYLDFPAPGGGTTRVNGFVGVNLITGEFYNLNFELKDPFIWNIPEEDPVLTFNINSASIGLEGLFIRGVQAFKIGDETIPVQFDNLLLDLTTFRVKSGSVRFSEKFALEAGIDQVDFSLGYGVKQIKESLSETLDPGIFFALAGEVMIDSLGLRANGSADAQLRFGGMTIDRLSVEFSDDFAFGLNPFRVAHGKIDILYDGQLIAVIDQNGFHPVFGFFDLEAIIPERLPMPAMEIAYMVVKENDKLLIDVQKDPEDEMIFIINTSPGRGVEYVFPILQGDQPTPPSITVEFTNVRMSMSPLNIYDGQIIVNLPEDDNRFDLSRFGIPLDLKAIAYGSFPEEDINHKGLFFVGDFTLFDHSPGEEANITMLVNGNGALFASFELNNLDGSIPLVAGSQLASLSIESVSGYGEFPILTPDFPDFMFHISGGFEIVADAEHSARADVSLEYSRQGISVTQFDYQTTGKEPKLDIDPFIFRVDNIHSLSMDWDREEGFEFHSQLDIAMGMRLDEDTLLIPLQGVEIRQNGLAIPAQEVNDGSEPALQVPPLELLGFRLQTLAFRTQQVTVDIFNFTPGDLAGLIPSLDFALSFPGLEEAAPQLQGLSLTILNAGYSNGRLTGTVEVHEPIQPIEFPMGDLLMEVKKFAGTLSEIIEDGVSRQQISIDIEGEIPGVASFETDQECAPATFAVSIVEGSGIRGNMENFVPCGELPIGSLGLSFTSSGVDFDFMDGEQSIVLSGAAALSIPVPGESDDQINVSGELAFDLMNSRILDGSIQINHTFNWNVPVRSENPFFVFEVQQATLSAQGLTLTAEGQLKVADNLNVDVSFNQLTFDIRELEITDGEAILSSDFAVDLLFLPVHWQLAVPGSPMASDMSSIRMDFENLGVVLNKDGFGLTGQSSAMMNIMRSSLPGNDDDPQEDAEEEEDDQYNNLRLVFTDDFMLYVPPASYAKSGRAELWLDQENDDSTLLAWYDESGLRIGDVLDLLPIPDTLGLPSKEIAYMVLRDENGLLVELETTGDQRTLRTLPGKTVDIVIAGLTNDNENHPRFGTEFSISVNDAFEITDGSINVSLENNPWQVPQMPISLTSLTYEKRDDGVAALSASALLTLPESLNELQVIIDEVRFSQNGFEQASFSIGDPQFALDGQPAVSQAFADSALVINVFHANAAFGETNAFRIDGTFQSNLFRENDSGDLTPMVFFAQYEQLPNPGGQWNFGLSAELADTLAVSYARFYGLELEAVATTQDFNLLLSGIMDMPDVLGEDFAVTIENLSIGTSGISVGAFSVEMQEQEFSFFNERLILGISSMQPSYEANERVFYLTMDGHVKVLNDSIAFSQMQIGTNGSFSIAGGMAMDLLHNRNDLTIIENTLVITSAVLGINDQNRLQFSVTGDATLPEPFGQSAEFTVSMAQVPGQLMPDIDIQGPAFQFGEGYAIEAGRTQVSLGEFATIDLLAAAVMIDFKEISNTTFLASAAVYITNDVDKRIELGSASNIYENWGIRYNYNDGLQWQITSAPSAGNPLFSFDAGFFMISIEAVGTGNNASEFSVEIGGMAQVTIPGITGSAEFSGFTVSKNGIDDIGRFDKNVTLTVMDKVELSLGAFEWNRNPSVLTIVEESPSSTMEDPEYTTRNINTTQYLRILDASITINLDQNGSGSVDNMGGGVEEVLFYQTPYGGTYLFIDNAWIQVRDVAEMTLSMRYITSDTLFHLSAAGTGSFSFGETGASIGVAGKFERAGNGVSFGLFVKADVTPGIPIIPAIITLNGLGGGFYYRPSATDFSDVRDVSGLTFLESTIPEFNPDTRFAVFLYAGVGLIGEAGAYYVDGTFFFEITDNFFSLHVNGRMMGQPEENLFARMALTIQFGSEPMVQGLIRVDVGYQPVVAGYGEIGFFAKKQQPETIWAIFGKKELSVLGALNLTSDFIVCNDGMLIDTKLGVGYQGFGITIAGELNASIWYMKNNGFGAYGLVAGSISGYGVTLEAFLYGAYISSESLFYASGGVFVDVFVFSGTLEGYIAYKSGKWDGGRGSHPEYVALINRSRQQALAMKESASQAVADVNAAIADLENAAQTQGLVNSVLSFAGNLPAVSERQATMNQRVQYVSELAPVVTGRLASVIDHAIDLLDETEQLSQQLTNPVNVNRGLISGEDDDMEVLQNPSIQFSEGTAESNESNLQDQQTQLQERIAEYRNIITNAIGNLSELEMAIEGRADFTLELLDAATLVMGPAFSVPINTFTPVFNPTINIQPISFGPLASSALMGSYYQGGGVNLMSYGDFSNFMTQYRPPSFNYLGEKYTEAVESIKDFYSIFSSALWVMRVIYSNLNQTANVNAVMQAINQTQQKYNSDMPALEQSHQSFTQSLDLLYSIKGQMTATIYGMLTAYAQMLESSMEEEELHEVQQRQIEIAQKLEPPVISSFIVNPNYWNYRNQLEITWVAQHVDEVAETSFSIRPSGIGAFSSAGEMETFNHYTFRRTLNDTQRSYTIALRARGSGGNTSIRSTNVTLAVHPSGTSSPGGEQTPGNIPPPSTPVIAMPDYKGDAVGWFIVRQYTNDASQINFRITAYAPSSDIASFSYAIGTQPGATDIVDWTTAVGVIEPVNINQGGVSRRINVSATGLSLEHNTEYFVSVRAYNTQGLFRERISEIPLLFDATAPSAPENTTPAVSATQPWILRRNYPVVAFAPGWESPKYTTPSAFEFPSHTVSWAAATDPESGILHYEYVISEQADPDLAFQQHTDVLTTVETSLTYSSHPLNYIEPLYFHVRAVNKSGSHSDAITIEPFMAIDHTPPSTPIANLYPIGHNLRVYLPRLSVDLESQTRGYQYSVGTSRGLSNVRSWSEDFVVNQSFNVVMLPGYWAILPAEPTTVPRFNVPRAGLPENTNLFVNVRAVNSQGMRSGVATTGPFQLGTVPAEPTISASYSNSVLSITIGNIFDPGMPILNAQYRVLDALGNPIRNWTTISSIRGVYTQPGSVQVSPVIQNLGIFYSIQVRINNIAGQNTTATSYFQPTFTYNPPTIQPIIF